MPRTKANLKAALQRKLAENAGKRAAAKPEKPAPFIKRGRMWRTNWLREIRKAQSSASANATSFRLAPFQRLVREIDHELHGESHRWTDDAIKALREEAENRMTEMLKAANALTVTIGRKQTINRPALRLAATMLGLELPQPRQKLSVLRAAAARGQAAASAPKESSGAQTPAESSA